MKRALFVVGLSAALLASPRRATAQKEVGHYAPGAYGIRDYVTPAAGFYGALYSYLYTTNRLNDSNGDELNSLTIGRGPGPGVPIGVDVDVNVFVLVPVFVWVLPWEVLGVRYGGYIAPTFGTTSVGASLARLSGAGRSAEASQFGLGDLFVQPIWLTLPSDYVDVAASYGFYAPIGAYDTETITVPVIGALTAEAADNIGFGFWTHQLQGAVSVYPWVDKRMAVTANLTYEFHGDKEDFDLDPGDDLSLSWGVSQYLPLQKDQKVLLEVGVAGYDSWQISNDMGLDAAVPREKDQVHAVGGQLGVTHVGWNSVLNARYFYEVAAIDRFQGMSFGLNFAIKF